MEIAQQRARRRVFAPTPRRQRFPAALEGGLWRKAPRTIPPDAMQHDLHEKLV